MDILCSDCGEVVEDFHICHALNTLNDDENEVPLYTTVQNIEELINEVFIRSPLWDSTLPHVQRGPSVIKSLWSEIDNKLYLQPGTASTKWRNLRDTYVRKLSEQNKYVPSGSSAEIRAKQELWPYFNLLGFLRPTVARRKTFSNIKPVTSGSNNNLGIQQPAVKPTSSYTTSATYDSDSCNSNNNIFLQESCSTPSVHTHDRGISENSLMRSYKKPNFKSETANTALKRTSYKSNTDIEQPKSVHPLNIFKEKASIKVSESSAGKKRRTSGNKENDNLSLLEQSLLSQLKTTDESINTTTDPIIAFCSYLATQLRTLPPDNFKKCQRKILSFLFELQDS